VVDHQILQNKVKNTIRNLEEDKTLVVTGVRGRTWARSPERRHLSTKQGHMGNGTRRTEKEPEYSGSRSYGEFL